MYLALTAVLSALASSIASPEAHTGLQLHADVGAISTASETTVHDWSDGYPLPSLGEVNEDYRVSTVSAAFAVSAGYAVVPNLILGGEVWATVAPGWVHVSGHRQSTDYGTYWVYGIGPKLSFYFMPSDFYFSITPSVTEVILPNATKDSTGSPKWGFGARAAVGKEWRVSERWGLGLAGVMHLSWNDGTRPSWASSQASHPSWSTFGWGLVLSATRG